MTSCGYYLEALSTSPTRYIQDEANDKQRHVRPPPSHTRYWHLDHQILSVEGDGSICLGMH